MPIPKILYAVYGKLNDSILIKLNLSICKDAEISLIIQEIPESLDELNTRNDYFNNVCYTTTLLKKGLIYH